MCAHQHHLSSDSIGEWSWPSSHRPAAVTVLHPAVLHCTLQFLSPTAICAVSRVSTAFAHAARSDALWELVLQRDWYDDIGIEGAELQRRVRREARARRGLHDIDEMEELDAHHAAALAHVPVLTAQSLEGSPPTAPQSPEKQCAVAATSRLSIPTMRHDSGIPRARSIAALNTMAAPSPVGNGAGLGRAGLGLSPRPSTPSAAHRQPSPDSDSSSDTISPPPLRRTVSDSALASTSSLPFSFPTPAQVAAAFSPRPSPRSEALAAQRWLAPPASWKCIYSDVVQASYARFQVEHHVQVSERLPRPLKLTIAAGLAVALVAFVAIHLRDSSQSRSLCLLYTTSMTVVLTALVGNVCRVLRRSLQARQVLWREPPLLSEDASPAEMAAAAADAAFQATDQAWWRHRFANRFYYVRYQVWAHPRMRWLLILLAGVGAFVLLWVGVTLALGSWWPAAGGLLGITFPGLTLLLAFQLGRMLHVSRTTHIVVAVALSVLQLCCLLFLLRAGCTCLVWLLNQSSSRSLGSMAASFAPNLFLCLFLLWTADGFLHHSWAPVVLPPRVAAFHQDELQLAEQGAFPHAPLALTIESERDAEDSAASESDTEGGDAWSAERYIPVPHTLGRLLCGSEFERSWIEGRFSRRMRARLFSPGCVAVLAGLAAYAVTHPYWTQLFSLYTNPDATFLGQSLPTRMFHLLSLVQAIWSVVCATILATVVLLQNRDWRWWWQGAYVNATTAAAICAHYAFWLVAQESALSTQAGADDGDAYASLMDASERLRAFHSQIATHFVFSWATSALALCACISVSLGATLAAMLLLYRPKSVRSMMKDAAKAEEAAVAAAQAAARDQYHRRASLSRLPAHLYPVLSEPQPSASPSVDSLAYSVRAPLTYLPATPLSFLQSLQQPASPAIDLRDPALSQHAFAAHEHDRRGERFLQYPRV